MEILDAGDTILWRNFGYENNWEDRVDFSGLESVGPFTFEKKKYEEALLGALEKLSELNATPTNSPGPVN